MNRRTFIAQAGAALTESTLASVATAWAQTVPDVKLEIEKSHIDKITRPEADTEKVVTAKVS